MFFNRFFVSFKKTRESLSLFFKEGCERIAQVAHDKQATVIQSLRSLTKNERITRVLFYRIAHLLIPGLCFFVL